MAAASSSSQDVRLEVPYAAVTKRIPRVPSFTVGSSSGQSMDSRLLAQLTAWPMSEAADAKLNNIEIIPKQFHKKIAVLRKLQEQCRAGREKITFDYDQLNFEEQHVKELIKRIRLSKNNLERDKTELS